MRLSKFIPRTIVQTIKTWRNRWLLRRAVHRIKRGDTSTETLLLLLDGWNNKGYSGRPEYLERIAEIARSGGVSFLECGTGASTILLAAMGAKVTSLEHHPDWFRHVRAELNRLGLSANVHLTPLISYGEFDWYDCASITSRFSAVVCDGPPGVTRGGRYGLLPVAHQLLTDDCVILLDDTIRQEETQIMHRWCSEFGLSVAYQGDFAELRCNQAVTG